MTQLYGVLTGHADASRRIVVSAGVLNKIA